ncbi:glucose-6-phosphate dehydrogenase [Paenibacillus sp. strain BS8-2]
MEPTTFILFGATGDLAKRKIYPALFHLFMGGKLPAAFALIGLGRRDWSDEKFRGNVAQSIRDYARGKDHDEAQIESFLQAFSYSVLNIDILDDYGKLLHKIETREQVLELAPNRLFYLSVGPEYFETIAANIEKSGLGAADGWKRLVIEKPFGHNLQTARALNEMLGRAFVEEQIFRIDHYLGKPMLQRFKALQQSNPIIQALWTNRNIANVQITANETVGVEERAGYYDHVGALRDMFQNHMLQLLMMTAIRTSVGNDADVVRFKKKHIMEALEPLQKADVSATVVRGQYAAGQINGNPVAGYTSEPGITPGSNNDTFVAAKLTIDDSFWRGVPFYIRTGKRLKEKSTRIVIEFKEALQQSTNGDEGTPEPNLLVIEMSPGESISLQLNTMDGTAKENVKPIRIDIDPGHGDLPEAYENLIHDALLGDATYFAHWDEVEASWAWVQPILEAYEENSVPLYRYEAGTYGPSQADELLARDGYRWWFDAAEPVKQLTAAGQE